MMKWNRSMMVPATLLILSSCSLIKPGGLDTPQGQLELETVGGIALLGCSEAGPADAIKIDAGLALLQNLILNEATNAEAVTAFGALDLPPRWRNRLLVTLRIAQKWVSTQVDTPEALQTVTTTVVNACREGLGQIS